MLTSKICFSKKMCLEAIHITYVLQLKNLKVSHQIEVQTLVLSVQSRLFYFLFKTDQNCISSIEHVKFSEHSVKKNRKLKECFSCNTYEKPLPSFLGQDYFILKSLSTSLAKGCSDGTEKHTFYIVVSIKSKRLDSYDFY